MQTTRRLRQKQCSVTAAAMALIMLAPVFYLAAHTCLHSQSPRTASLASSGHQLNFCNSCVFEWLSLFMLSALSATGLLDRAGFVPGLRPQVLFARPAVSPTSRAPPRLP